MGVLLVGDRLENQEILGTTLKEAGFSALFVYDGLSGLDAAIAEQPELIILNSCLEGIDMVDFVKKIRGRTYLANIPVILLIQREEDSDPFFLQSVRIQATLNKPIDPALLSQEVVNQIGSSLYDGHTPLPVSEQGVEAGVEAGVEPISTPIDSATRGLVSPAYRSNTSQPVATNQEPPLVLDHTLIQKNILEVVEKVLWDVLPGTIQMAIPKEALQSMIERIVWETVPALAEIEIKKEIKRLQPAE